MFSKILVCGVTLGCIMVLTTILDRGHARVLDHRVQLPVCEGSETLCSGMAATANASTERFFAMLAAN
jgi:hypothetical protein